MTTEPAVRYGWPVRWLFVLVALVFLAAAWIVYGLDDTPSGGLMMLLLVSSGVFGVLGRA